MDQKAVLSQCEGFEWDQGNSLKNLRKHKVHQGEAEQVFFNEPFLLREDEKHSKNEDRFLALGQTDDRRLLVIVFTIRNKFIRVISARDMNRKERKVYEKA